MAARFELFLLGDGEKKVTEEVDTRESSFSYRSFALESRNRSFSLSAKSSDVYM